MSVEKLTPGEHLEKAGILTFSCSKCRDAFPERCDEHRRTPKTEAKKPKRKSKRASAVSEEAVVTFSSPILRCDAPYEVLEHEIRDALGMRHPR